MGIFKSKIERLDAIQKKLEKADENKNSQTLYINSKIEAKIKKLEEKAYYNRVELDNFRKDIKIKLDKNAALIRAEAEYAKKLGERYGLETKVEEVKKEKGKK